MRNRKNMRSAIGCILLLSVMFLCGCGAETPATTTGLSPAEAGGQRLCISGTVTDDGVSKQYPVPGTERVLSVAYLDDVTVELDGKAVSLEQALKQGKITPEEVAAWARLDAVDGYCDVEAVSERGLSRFFYYYEKIIVEVVNDVYETPDGKQHLIETVDVYTRGKGRADASHTYHGDDGYPIDREDWGLTFTVKDVTSTGMTLVIEQSGGQQVGELEISGFSLFSMDDNHAVSVADQEKKQNDYDAIKSVITQNGTTEIQLDWTEVYGELPAGEYFMMPSVEDIYDESQIHPLIVKYKNNQSYRIIFTIP